MKKYTLFLFGFFIVQSLSSQQPYLIGYGGVGIKNDNFKSIFGLSAGLHVNKQFTVGAGVSALQYQATYLPITADFTFTAHTERISPVAMLRGGYGLYSDDYGTGEVKGGPSGSLMAGVSFPLKGRLKALVMAGYSLQTFEVKGILPPYRHGFNTLGTSMDGIPCLIAAFAF